MGEPHPNLQFDYAAARDVISQAQNMINALRTETTARSQKVEQMRPNWKGNYADQFFGKEVPRMKTQAGNLVTELQGLITQMNGAISTANQWAQQNTTYNNNNVPKPSAAPGPTPTPPPGP